VPNLAPHPARAVDFEDFQNELHKVGTKRPATDNIPASVDVVSRVLTHDANVVLWIGRSDTRPLNQLFN
jgi:hypothetical protein